VARIGRSHRTRAVRHARTARSSPPRATYRHGNVRAEAVAAAREQVVAKGHEAVSLRRVAERIGIAHRSLYNHFADREALLDAVAEVGFVELAAALTTAHTQADLVRTYVEFALHNRRLFALMESRPHATMKRKPTFRYDSCLQGTNSAAISIYHFHAFPRAALLCVTARRLLPIAPRARQNSDIVWRKKDEQ